VRSNRRQFHENPAERLPARIALDTDIDLLAIIDLVVGELGAKLFPATKLRRMVFVYRLPDVQRQREKSFHHGEVVGASPRRNAVVDDVKETDLVANPANPGTELATQAAIAGKPGLEIDDGYLARH
jgi:hypothetical protein